MTQQTIQRETVKHLYHLNLSVDDLDATADWYERVFDFNEVERGVSDDGTQWRILRGGDAMLCCYQHSGLEVKKGPRLRAHGLHGFNHFSLRILNEAAWRETLVREQVKIGWGGPIDYPHSRSWYVIDPTGYEIEVVLWHDDVIGFAG